MHCCCPYTPTVAFASDCLNSLCGCKLWGAAPMHVCGREFASSVCLLQQQQSTVPINAKCLCKPWPAHVVLPNENKKKFCFVVCCFVYCWVTNLQVSGSANMHHQCCSDHMPACEHGITTTSLTTTCGLRFIACFAYVGKKMVPMS